MVTKLRRTHIADAIFFARTEAPVNSEGCVMHARISRGKHPVFTVCYCTKIRATPAFDGRYVAPNRRRFLLIRQALEHIVPHRLRQHRQRLQLMQPTKLAEDFPIQRNRPWEKTSSAPIDDSAPSVTGARLHESIAKVPASSFPPGHCGVRFRRRLDSLTAAGACRTILIYGNLGRYLRL